MLRPSTSSSSSSRPAPPDFSTLLKEVLDKPGSVMNAYSAFYNYSIGNQLLAMWQCSFRGLEIGPIKTFPAWKDVGRTVRRGEKALQLCMPVTFKRRGAANRNEGELDPDDSFTTGFIYKPNWFVLSQTEGAEIEVPPIPGWNKEQSLITLDITEVPFASTNGNSQGYARKREIAINPLAQLPHKTRFHELAHVLLGHTSEADFEDGERPPRNLQEVEAESVALLCCEALGLEGADFCRGYIQGWADGQPIPEQNAKRIMGAADKILRAGRPPTTKNETIH